MPKRFEDIYTEPMPHDLGPCCACGDTGAQVRNIVCLEKAASVLGAGWGCAVCGLPANGAVAVLCDRCLDARVNIRFAVVGYAAAPEHGRIPVEELSSFQHNLRRHAQLAGLPLARLPQASRPVRAETGIRPPHVAPSTQANRARTRTSRNR